MPSPAAAAIPAATVFAYPEGLYDYRAALPALAMVLVPAILMVSTIRFRSFKTLDLQKPRPYTVLILIAAGITLITTHPRFVLVLLAYAYLAVRVRRHGDDALQAPRDVWGADCHRRCTGRPAGGPSRGPRHRGALTATTFNADTAEFADNCRLCVARRALR